MKNHFNSAGRPTGATNPCNTITTGKWAMYIQYDASETSRTHGWPEPA